MITRQQLQQQKNNSILTVLIFVTLLASTILVIISVHINLVPMTTTPTPYSHPYIHIVKTRFLQDQSHLPNLSQARLQLFKHFCIPTMIHQTSNRYLWIIKTDPNLDEGIKRQLINMLKPYRNFYLVGSNTNYGIGREPGGWRGGEDGRDVLSSPIYTGDIPLLRSAHEYREKRVVVETRLDADDGLHSRFLEFIQDRVASDFFDNDDDDDKLKKRKRRRRRWIYYCQSRHVEWYPSDAIDDGRLLPQKGNNRICITPGITVVAEIGVDESDIPRYPHQRLLKMLKENEKKCGDDDVTECLKIVNPSILSSVRCRSPTSAGMKDVRRGTLREEDYGVDQEQAWDILEKEFFVTKNGGLLSNDYIKNNMEGIAKDNLKGQCTKGHSCKISSKEKLQQMIELMEYEKRNDYINIGDSKRKQSK